MIRPLTQTDSARRATGPLPAAALVMLALAVLPGCGGGRGRGPTAPDPPPPPPPPPGPSLSLTGDWERAQGSTFPELNGMVVRVNGRESRGVIVSTPSNVYHFAAGDRKWRNIERISEGEYRFEDLIRQAGSGAKSYIPGLLHIRDDGREVMADFPTSGTVQRWRRVD